jgi:hypothetical protein
MSTSVEVVIGSILCSRISIKMLSFNHYICRIIKIQHYNSEQSIRVDRVVF